MNETEAKQAADFRQQAALNAATPKPRAGEHKAPGDRMLEAYKLAPRVLRPSSQYGDIAQQLAEALLTNKEITTELAEAYETIKAERDLLREGCRELLEVLEELVTRCDGAEGVRADGSNIQTMRASALLAKHGR